jgi:hypothetical protein
MTVSREALSGSEIRRCSTIFHVRSPDLLEAWIAARKACDQNRVFQWKEGQSGIVQGLCIAPETLALPMAARDGHSGEKVYHRMARFLRTG